MTRVVQKSNGRGSLRNIQILINKKQCLIDEKIKSSFNELKNEQIIWTSPIEADEFAEYRDNDFLKKVGLDPTQINLNNFWPPGGPQWDALAKTEKGHIILVEAKANLPELFSSATRASGESKEKIDNALNETKSFLNVTSDTDWSSNFYQYANRLAHLYFLREKCKKETFLVNIYFLGDQTVSGPNTEEEWKKDLQNLNEKLGLNQQHKLSDYMADIFIDVKDLEC